MKLVPSISMTTRVVEKADSMSTTMQLPPSSPSSEVDDDVSHINDKSREAESSAASDTDLAIYADNDDDEQQHSMKKKIFGKKKIMRRKKYTKNSTNTSTGGTAADNAILHGAPSSPDEPLSGLDDSIVGSPPQTNIHQHKQKRQKVLTDNQIQNLPYIYL